MMRRSHLQLRHGKQVEGRTLICTSTTMMHGGGPIKLWEKPVILEEILLKSATYLRLKLEQPQTGAVAVQT